MKPGEKVICIKDNPGRNCPIRKGDIVVIQEILKCTCGEIILDLGINLPKCSTETICGTCSKTLSKINWYQHANRFRPLNDRFCHDELINSIIEEKQDAEPAIQEQPEPEVAIGQDRAIKEGGES